MKTYIAGPISGLTDVPLQEKKDRFYRAEAELIARGHEVVNPLDVQMDTCDGDCNTEGHIGQDGVPTHSWSCFMRHDLRALLMCDSYVALPGWGRSSGARLEVSIADALKMTQIHLEEK